MPQSSDSHNSPFGRLTHGEVNDLRAALDIGYFRPGEVIIERNDLACTAGLERQDDAV
jgi:CBS domain-containing protein